MADLHIFLNKFKAFNLKTCMKNINLVKCIQNYLVCIIMCFTPFSLIMNLHGNRITNTR